MRPPQERGELKLNRKLFIFVSILTIVVIGVSCLIFVVILQSKYNYNFTIDNLKRYLFATSFHNNLQSNTCSSKLAFIQHTKVITKNLKISLN